MSVLSVFKDGLFVGCASPTLITSAVTLTPGASLTFEIFEVDAASLKVQLGQVERYALESTPLERRDGGALNWFFVNMYTFTGLRVQMRGGLALVCFVATWGRLTKRNIKHAKAGSPAWFWP